MTADQTPAVTMHQVALESGEQFHCPEDEKVLIAMEQMGVTGVQIGCRGGGCGACRVEVISGEYESLKMSKKYVDDAEAAQGFALACRILPKSDLVLRAAPKELPEHTDEPQALAANG